MNDPRFSITPPASLRRFVTKAARRALRYSAQSLNQWSDTFLTYHERPKSASAVHTKFDPDLVREPSAVVMQGPIWTADDFTVETLRLYRQQMPWCHLILSTWTDTPSAELEPIRALGVDIVLSEKPAVPGLCNVNMQITNTAAGIRRAAEIGSEWVLKTRTDQRIFSETFYAFLVALAKTFPVKPGFDQKHRIIGVGQGTLKYAPHHVTDQTVFGATSDMLKYFEQPYRPAELPSSFPATLQEIFVGVPIGDICRHAAPESYFASQFLARIGRGFEWTIEDSWAAYRDHFCFVDYATTDFFWVKVQSSTLQEFTSRYDLISNRHEMAFRDWLLLYTGQLPIEAARRHERVLDTCFHEPVPSDDPHPDTSGTSSSSN